MIGSNSSKIINPMNYASYSSPSSASLKFNEPMISFSSAWRHNLPFTSQQMMSLRTTTAGRPVSTARAGRHICHAHKPGLKAAAAVSSSTNGLPVVVSPERSKVEAEDMEAAAFCPPVRRPVAGSVATEDMTSLVHNRLNSFVEEEIEISVNGGSSTELGPEEGLGIVRFLTAKKLLITGATGFLAKVLIEKILRAAPDVGKIYVLIKAKDKDDAKRRMISEIINTELFERHREVHGRDYHNFLKSKLVPVVGNVRDHGLGIDPELANEITDEVDIIVNSAANTTFDERYDIALDINTKGPCRLMGLAKRCKKLKLFLHVSTAYVNGQRQGKVQEKAFSLGHSIARERVSSWSMVDQLPILDVKEELRLAFDSSKGCDDNSRALKMKELGLQRARMYGWQDTYVFTKAMGEMLLDSIRGEIPVVNIRPSVIESTWKEPFPGWMEGNRMMDPIILHYGKGQLAGFLADPKGVLDVVPADMVVNATLAAMARHGKCRTPGMHIYHVASSVKNPLVFKELADLLFLHFQASPYMDATGVPIHVPKMKLFQTMEEFTSFVSTDTLQRLGGAQMTAGASIEEKVSQRQHSIYVRALEQAKYLANLYEPYTFYAGRFVNSNTHKLLGEMSAEERTSFEFDVGAIDWKDYISNVHIPGLRRHVMKGRGTS